MITKKIKTEIGNIDIVVSDIWHNADEFPTSGAVRAIVKINDQITEFFEFEQDGFLDRSCDSAYNNCQNEGLKSIIRDIDENNDDDDLIINTIYDIIDEQISASITFDQVYDFLQKKGYHFHGRDPYHDNKWHVAEYTDDSKTVTITVNHFHTLKEILTYFNTGNSSSS